MSSNDWSLDGSAFISKPRCKIATEIRSRNAPTLSVSGSLWRSWKLCVSLCIFHGFEVIHRNVNMFEKFQTHSTFCTYYYIKPDGDESQRSFLLRIRHQIFKTTCIDWVVSELSCPRFKRHIFEQDKISTIIFLSTQDRKKTLLCFDNEFLK